MEAALLRVQLKIRGRVQGVGFRWATEREAVRLGLAGWVRNTEDGAVEVVAEGEKEFIDRFVTWCHRGPAGARVDGVDERRVTASGGLGSFRITY